jgi:hypothetical protein
VNLPAEIYSPDQISELTLELRNYIDTRRDRNLQKQTGADVPPPPMSTELRKLFEATSEEVGTPESLLLELEKVLRNYPVVHLLLAATPGISLKKQLTLWFRTEIDHRILLTFNVRHDIGGGAMVRAGSKVYDFTFRKKILDNKHRITELA